jgi:hypothetical protein
MCSQNTRRKEIFNPLQKFDDNPIGGKQNLDYSLGLYIFVIKSWGKEFLFIYFLLWVDRFKPKMLVLKVE